MRFQTINRINGDHRDYQISPAIKPYSLMDTGFRRSNAGNYVLKRSLGSINGPRLKVVVQKNLKAFKMDVTDGKGLRKINIFNSQNSAEKEQLNYVLEDLVSRKILQPRNGGEKRER